MKTIYHGDVNRLFIKNLDITENGKCFSFASVTVEKNALFYRGIFGRPINFEHKTYLPDLAEATDFLFAREKEGADCIYVNYEQLLSSQISNKEFKQLKKQFSKKLN